ncbi:AAA family ATPase [Streptomyces sp. NBC_01795]|uniref:helix-hairpin-helix domain-containing protein n=1 Tax=Streptomyces sp. NBC_01795 TaxID=2975943 RepID=UPI002DD82A5C|nr:helix-hairpin-helix domain-containing protein [Streptomyces sp. NBC_01795]WSA96133.1 AAA family ATPase [Streptomyces sp. NBC_01795]
MTNDKAAELLAAVRAVESGERPAASFFTETARPAGPSAQAKGAAPRRPAPGSVPPARPARGDGPVTVPDEVRALLTECGAPEALGPRVAEALGEGAAELLRADPWQLLAVTGVRPEQADGFARALLSEEAGPGDERRAVALVVWLLERAALAGDTVLGPEALAKGLTQHAVPDPEEAVRQAVDAGAVLVFEDALDGGPVASAMDESEAEERPVTLLVGLDRYALAEESLADGLARITSTFTASEARETGAARETDAAEGGDGEGSGDDAGAAPVRVSPAEWAAAASAAPSPSARELIHAASGHGLVAHTGGEAARAEPAALVAAAHRLGLRAWVLAHTDDGRDRLTRFLGEQLGGAAPDAQLPAATVAGVLAGAEGPGRDEDGALAVDLLAVCDAPQLDAETAAALLESLPDGARLVLSGDPAVLGAAGPGQLFKDLLAARFCPQVASRTPDPGPVGELVSGIGVGELNQVVAPGKEVVIVPVADPGEAVHRTVQLVADSVPRAIGVPSEDTQVITVGHGGAAGTRALNAALKERLNPGPGRFGGFDPGDRVAHSPAPGRTRMGTVASADDTGLHLACAGRTVTVPPDRVADTVRHGWAVTAHQAAGTRWPAAVVVLPGDVGGALTREWVYTAFGRGARHLSVVHGAGDALPHAVASGTAQDRVTRLRTLLTESAKAAAAAAASAVPVADTSAAGEGESEGEAESVE